MLAKKKFELQLNFIFLGHHRRIFVVKSSSMMTKKQKTLLQHRSKIKPTLQHFICCVVAEEFLVLKATR
jgi:hypothetical protein